MKLSQSVPDISATYTFIGSVVTVDDLHELTSAHLGDICYVAETLGTYIYADGWQLLSSANELHQDKDPKMLSRITNCVCCGAILPETTALSVKCEYCGAIQDAYIKTSTPCI